MERIGLKQEYLDRIKTDNILYADVSKALNIHPLSLPKLLKMNHRKLVFPEVIEILKVACKVKQDTTFYTKVQEKSKNDSKPASMNAKKLVA